MSLGTEIIVNTIHSVLLLPCQNFTPGEHLLRAMIEVDIGEMPVKVLHFAKLDNLMEILFIYLLIYHNTRSASLALQWGDSTYFIHK